MEPQQLPDRHDLGVRWRTGHSRAHLVQGNILHHLGRLILGENQRLRGINEVQEAHPCPAIRPESNPKSAIYPVVEPHNQPGKCICWISGATRSHWYLHARKNPDAENIPNPNFSSSSMVEDTRAYSDGYL